MQGASHFTISKRWNAEAHKHERIQVATCGKCGAREGVRDAGERPKPVSPMASYFRQRGWHIAARPVGDLCPKCAAGKPTMKSDRELTPAQKRAAYCRINNVPRPGEEPAIPEPIPMVADEPRQPSPAERRRVLEEVEARWNTAKGCYEKAWTDKALAESLNVPRAWVADVREQFFGAEKNEARDAVVAEAKAIRTEIEALQTDFLERFDALEKRLKKVELDLSYGAAA